MVASDAHGEGVGQQFCSRCEQDTVVWRVDQMNESHDQMNESNYQMNESHDQMNESHGCQARALDYHVAECSCVP
jgi:hypothetical protein